MTDQELRYYYPYWIDRKHNFRGMRKDSTIKKRLEPEYEKVFENGQYISRMKGLNEPNKYLEITKNAYILEDYSNWCKWFEKGQNIFSFSEELLKMLSRTDVKDIKYSSFNLPYDNLYISLKPLGIEITDGSGKIVEGVYVSIDRMAMDYQWKDEDPLIFDYAISFNFVGDFIEQKLIDYDKIWDGYGDGIGGADFWKYEFYFIEKDSVITIDDAINDTKRMFKSCYFPEDENEISDIHLDAYNRYIYFIDKTYKVLVNTLLYLSLPQESREIVSKYPNNLPHNFNQKISFAKTNKEKRKVNNKIKESGFSKIHYVGLSFGRKPTNTLENSIEQSPHWRRGHWRNQAYGTGLNKNKLVWIKPTIVNKDLGNPEKGHVYEV